MSLTGTDKSSTISWSDSFSTEVAISKVSQETLKMCKLLVRARLPAAYTNCSMQARATTRSTKFPVSSHTQPYLSDFSCLFERYAKKRNSTKMLAVKARSPIRNSLAGGLSPDRNADGTDHRMASRQKICRLSSPGSTLQVRLPNKRANRLGTRNLSPTVRVACADAIKTHNRPKARKTMAMKSIDKLPHFYLRSSSLTCGQSSVAPTPPVKARAIEEPFTISAIAE